MLTQQDIDVIREIVTEVVDERTRLLPTRDKFFTKMSEVMGELSKTVEILEKIHPNGTHASR